MEKDIERYRSKDVVWAVFLIFVGTVFLLNTTGVVSWSIWSYILRFWPVFLILGGLKLIMGKSALAEILLSVLALILFLFVGLVSYLTYTQSRIDFLPESVNRCITGRCMGFVGGRESIEKQMVVAQDDYPEILASRAVRLNIGAAEFELIDADVSNHLTVRALYPSRYITPKLSSEVSGDRLRMDFRSASFSGFTFFYNDRSEYDLVLGQKDLLTDLDINLGAGSGTVYFDEVVTGEILSKVGAGKLVLRLGERSIPSERIVIDVGAGEVTLELPEEVGYTLEYDLGVGTITGNGKDIATFIGSEKRYESENYDSAELKVRIVAKVGVGTLNINSR